MTFVTQSMEIKFILQQCYFITIMLPIPHILFGVSRFEELDGQLLFFQVTSDSV